MDEKELKEKLRKILPELLEEGLGNGTYYLTNDKLHISASTPKVQLEGTETNAKNLSMRENAGELEVYDEAAGAKVYGIYPHSKDSATNSVTIPLGGGSAAITVTLSGLSSIDYVTNIQVTNIDPDTQDIYSPRGMKVDGNVVGMTLAAGTGTTLTVLAEGIGQL